MFIKVGQYVLVYIVLIVIFISVLFLTSLLPRSYLHPHIEKTIITLKSEGIYPSFGIPWRKIVLDNYTDALMFNTAYNSSELEPLKASLINLRYYEPQLGSNQIDQLEASLNYTDKSQAGYERYWHGYLTYLRPAVILFSYDAIRIFNAIMLYGGFSWLLILCWKKLGKKFALAILLGFISVDFFFIWKSLQFSAVFLLAIYAAIYLLKSKKKQNYIMIFFIVGGLTSFFDLLTAPLITLGMLLIISTKLYKTTWQDIIKMSAMWSIGYVGLWASKWIIVQLLFVPHAIQTSIDQIVNRTITEPDSNFSYFNTLKLNIFQLIGYDKSNKIIVLILAIITVIFTIKYFSFDRKKMGKIFTLILMGIIPYAWYLVAANHSYLHVWYTYRIQFISVVCFVLIMCEFVDWKKVKTVLSYK